MEEVLPVILLLELVPSLQLLRITGVADLLWVRGGDACRHAYAGSDHVRRTPSDRFDVIDERAGADGVEVDDERCVRSVLRYDLSSMMAW